MIYSHARHHRSGLMLLAFFAVLCVCALLPTTALSEESVYLATFMDRTDGCSDYVYVSRDGIRFERISVAYQAKDRDGRIVKDDSRFNWDVYSLHDPGLGYKDGVYWMLSGDTPDENKDGIDEFRPMFGSSRDLENWSFPRKPAGVAGNVDPLPDTKGKLANGEFDCAGPDFLFDDNGDCWLVVPLGYYGAFHGDAQNDFMQPYIARITDLARNPECDTYQEWCKGPNLDAQPSGNSGAFTRINLPVADKNWIDPSLYKENGKYYLSIKKNGVQNYIFEIDDLNNAGNADAWRTVNTNVVTGYEGPCLTRSNDGTYFFYTDKLADFKDANGIGMTGIYYQTTKSLDGSWTAPKPIATIDASGDALPNRHGSVLRIDDPAAQKLILDLRTKAGFTPFTDVFKVGSKPTAHASDIEWLAEAEISKGWDDHTFRPYEKVARADMAAFLYRLGKLWGIVDDSWQPTGKATFCDVSEKTPHYREILWLAENEVSKGWDMRDGTFEFRPYEKVARADMAAFLARMYRLTGRQTLGADDFLDVTSTTPHEMDIRWLAAVGVSTGWQVPGGREFRPLEKVARADMAAFLQRLNGLVPAISPSYDASTDVATSQSDTVVLDASIAEVL